MKKKILLIVSIAITCLVLFACHPAKKCPAYGKAADVKTNQQKV